MSSYASKGPSAGGAVGGGKATVVAGTATPIALGNSSEYWILSTADIFVAGAAATGTPTLTIANSTTMGAGLYGPFHRTSGTAWLHIAGNGAGATVTVTVL